jgi:hypothetical protein
MKRIAGRSLVAGLLIMIAAPCAVADPVQWAGNGHWYEVVTSFSGTWDQAVQAGQGMSWIGVPGHLVKTLRRAVACPADAESRTGAEDASAPARWRR